MNCSVCGKPLPGRALNCPDCGGAPAQWDPTCVFRRTPGGQPCVSPDGLVFTTDGKCRWVCQAEPPILARLVSSLIPGFAPKGRCILYTLDEQSITAQPLRDKVGRERVFQLISKWTGGQSHPSLRFDRPNTRRLRYLTSLSCDRDSGRIRLDGGEGAMRIYADREQLDSIYTLLSRQHKLLTQDA